jgi:2-dehydropantoate 2-reductase
VTEAPRIAVLGAGAVGCYFGGMMARAGLPVTLIARPPHREAIASAGLVIESFRFPEPLRIPIETAAEPEAVRGAALVLFCVKTVDTENAVRQIAPYLDRGAVVVSMQNGVDNVERIRTASGVDALGCAVYVGVEMRAPGIVRHSGRGDLIVGRFPGSNAPAELVESCCAAAGIPCRRVDDIRPPLWTKMFINCAYNAVSALGHSRYGAMAQRQDIRELTRIVVNEAVSVARAEGVPLPDEDFVATAWNLAASMPNAMSSTAQDLLRGKRTEIDSLNGYIARRGQQHGVATPVNQTLYMLVKLLEDSLLASQTG